MTWFKVDDALATHDKVLAAGNAAMGLWVRAGSWSAQHLTDGHVPAHAMRLLGTLGQAKALVKCGLWVEVKDGYQFHEWHDYQPTRESVEAERAKKAAAGKLGGLNSGRSRREASAKAPASGLVEPPSRPVPTLSVVATSSQSSSAPASLDDDGLTRISQALNNCPKTHARKTADFVLAKAPADVRNPVAYILAAVKEDPDAYRYRRGNPKRDQECTTHSGEWADACRGCAIDSKVGNA